MDEAVDHVIDRLEKKRTLALRTARRDGELLTNALHALRAGRTEVAEEFLERAIDGLDGLVAEMRA